MMQTIESLQAETAALNEINDRLQPILAAMRVQNAKTELELRHLMFQVWYLKTFGVEIQCNSKGLYIWSMDQARFESFCGALDMMKELQNG